MRVRGGDKRKNSTATKKFFFSFCFCQQKKVLKGDRYQHLVNAEVIKKMKEKRKKRREWPKDELNLYLSSDVILIILNCLNYSCIYVILMIFQSNIQLLSVSMHETTQLPLSFFIYLITLLFPKWSSCALFSCSFFPCIFLHEQL